MYSFTEFPNQARTRNQRIYSRVLGQFDIMGRLAEMQRKLLEVRRDALSTDIF